MSNNSTNNKIEYKYKIELSQSLTTGIFALHGNVKYDDESEASSVIRDLINNLVETENSLRKLGYKVAKDIEPKEKKDNKVETKEIKNTAVKKKVTK